VVHEIEIDYQGAAAMGLRLFRAAASGNPPPTTFNYIATDAADNQKNRIAYELPLSYDGPRWFCEVRADPVTKLLNLIIIVFQAGMELQYRGFAFN